MAEILHQQKINLVPHGIGFGRLRQEVLHQVQQSFRTHLRAGLQELAQLVYLDVLVDFRQPGFGLFDRFFTRRVDARFKIGAWLYVDGELAREFEVNGIQAAGGFPLGCEILHRRGWVHDFTIQLGTSPRKRAATTVLSR